MNPLYCYDDSSAVRVCIVNPPRSLSSQIADWVTVGAMSLLFLTLIVLAIASVQNARAHRQHRRKPPHVG